MGEELHSSGEVEGITTAVWRELYREDEQDEHGNILCPMCFRKHSPEKIVKWYALCFCGTNISLDYQLRLGKYWSEKRKESSMLYNLIIKFGDSFSPKVVLQAQALTYEQCDSQICKVRQSIKDQYGSELRDKKITVSMTPIEWVKLPEE